MEDARCDGRHVRPEFKEGHPEKYCVANRVDDLWAVMTRRYALCRSIRLRIAFRKPRAGGQFRADNYPGGGLAVEPCQYGHQKSLNQYLGLREKYRRHSSAERLRSSGYVADALDNRRYLVVGVAGPLVFQMLSKPLAREVGSVDLLARLGIRCSELGVRHRSSLVGILDDDFLCPNLITTSFEQHVPVGRRGA